MTTFGMAMAENSYENVLEQENRFLYNGKELQSDLDLDWYDYGARMYDPSIGRFMTIDPIAELYNSYSPFSYSINNPIRFIDFNGEGPEDRVKSARSMTGIEYKQESETSLRTGNKTQDLKYMDCSELVSRVLDADQITQGVKHMNTTKLKSFLSNTEVFEHSMDNPQVGDIAMWKGHVGIVTGVGEDGKIKLTHARGKGKLSKENKYAIAPEDYRDSEFYGYYRPINETPDGKLDENGEPIAENSSSDENKSKSDLNSKGKTIASDNTRVATNRALIKKINNLPQGKYKIINGKIVTQ